MNTMFKNITVSIVIIIFSLFFAGCEKVVDEDYSAYSFEVISSYGNVVGYYKIDSGAAQEFSGAPMDESVIFYSFNRNLSFPKSILVSATGAPSATSVSIYVYDNEILVDSATVSQVTASVPVTATLSHTFEAADPE
jgi:hypothetical protein